MPLSDEWAARAPVADAMSVARVRSTRGWRVDRSFKAPRVRR